MFDSLPRMLCGGLLSVATLLGFPEPCHAQFPAKAKSTGSGTPYPLIKTCVACHGALGAGTASGGPRLAGQDADYLAHALVMFRTGMRSSDAMQAVARKLPDNEIRELATFFAQQNPPLAIGAALPPQSQVIAGKQLAEMGAAPHTPACFTCHAAGGKGNGSRFPAIAGQPSTYVVARLHEFQTRAKTKTPTRGSMTAVAATLDDSQIGQVAAYLSVTKP